MKYIILLGVVSILGYVAWRYLGRSVKPGGAASITSIYDYSYRTIDGREVKLDSYRGKKILIVNVASECGFTPQYEGLEKLYREKKSSLVVLGFPANDFGRQEPGTNGEIASFCRDNYGITFPMSEKIAVVGGEKHPLYRWLTDASLNGWNSAEPKWNFHKYLVDEKGELLAVFPSSTGPLSGELASQLDRPPAR